MKKILLITFGILLTLTLIGLWLYLFVFNTTNNNPDEVFSNFETSTDTSGFTQDSTIENTSKTVDISPVKKLQQLTLRPVAGGIFFENNVRYIEKGTGYVYETSLTTGEEVQISNTTLPFVTDAIWSATGNNTILTTEENYTSFIFLGTLKKGDDGKTTLETIQLPDNAENVAFTGPQTISYSIPNGEGSSGYTYDIVEKTSKEVFSIVLQDIRVLWGDDIYVYTTPSVEVFGYFYKIKNHSELEYVAEKGNGLTAIRTLDTFIISDIAENIYGSFVYFKDSDSLLNIDLLPEKCTNTSATNTLICTTPGKLPKGDFPDDWYKGITSLQDSLWEISISTSTAEAIKLSDFTIESGRNIDAIKLILNEDTSKLLFINKNDDTLWMYNKE